LLADLPPLGAQAKEAFNIGRHGPRRFREFIDCRVIQILPKGLELLNVLRDRSRSTQSAAERSLVIGKELVALKVRQRKGDPLAHKTQLIFQPLQGNQVFIPALVHLPVGIVPEGASMRAICAPAEGYWVAVAVGPLGGVPAMRAFSSSVFKSKVL